MKVEEFWIATGPARISTAQRVIGPFGSQELALDVRSYIEEAVHREDLWVVSGEDIPPAKRGLRRA